MNVYLNYRIKFESEDEKLTAKSFFEELNCVVNVIDNQIYAFGSLEEYNSCEPVGKVYLDKAKAAYELLLQQINRIIELEGTIDTSETAGECMDFCISADNGQINVKCSPWYVETCMDDINDYEDFCDIVGDFSEEEYASVKENEYVYVLETDECQKLAAEVPLFDVEE